MLQFGSSEITALLQVIMIDLVLAGDNAIVIGLAAAGLPHGTTHESCPRRHRCGDGAPRNVCRSHNPVAASCGTCARGRHSPALGELEDVS